MRHRPLITILALLTLTAALPAAAGKPRTLVLVERATTDAVSVRGGPAHGDVPPGAPAHDNGAADNVGDILTFANEVFDASNTTKRGTDQGYCVRMIVGRSFECHWSLTLPEGQIMVDGPFLDSGDSLLAVTGGTGVYAGARGQLLLHPRDAKGGAFDFTYTLE